MLNLIQQPAIKWTCNNKRERVYNICLINANEKKLIHFVTSFLRIRRFY